MKFLGLDLDKINRRGCHLVVPFCFVNVGSFVPLLLKTTILQELQQNSVYLLAFSSETVLVLHCLIKVTLFNYACWVLRDFIVVFSSFRWHLLFFSALVTAAVLVPQITLAAEFVVNTPTTVSNGDLGTVLANGDTLTITDSGSISTVGDFNFAVRTIVDNATIINAGALSTNGNLAIGINALSNFNTISNLGTIFTSGTGSLGINALNNNIINNSGSITTTGTIAWGILATDSNIITNSGTIKTTSTFAGGITGNDINTITNTGSIFTTGEDAIGILGNNFNIITNTGTIFTTGADAIGIDVLDNNTINNSGYVVSAQSSSFEISGVGNTLNLMAPSFIGGAFDFDTVTNLNITTGRSQSVLWAFDPAALIGGMPNVNGDVPGAWNGSQFATIDPTSLSAAPDMLADNAAALSQITRSNNGVNAGNWWLGGFGGWSGYGAIGVNNDYTNANGGVAGGVSFDVNNSLNIGLMTAYLANNFVANSAWMTSQTITGQGGVVGVYGNAKLDNFFADFAIYAGAQNNDSSRLVNDNLAPLGIDYADANYNSWFIAPELRIGVDIATDGEWTLTPSVSGRISMQQIDGYTETGSNANATIGARNVQVFEGNIELAATRKVDAGSFTIAAGAQYRQNLGAGTQAVTLLGQNLAVPVNTAGSITGYLGLDATFDISGNSVLNLAAKAAIGANEYKSISGSLGIKTVF